MKTRDEWGLFQEGTKTRFPLVFVPLAHSSASLAEPGTGYTSIDLNTWEVLVQKGLSKFEETLAQ